MVRAAALDADTRKSTALSQVDEFFKELFPVLPPRPWRTLHGVGSAEGLAEVIGESGNKPFLLHYDELRSFVQKGKVDSSVLLPMVNTLFERGDYDTARSGHNESLALFRKIGEVTLSAWGWSGGRCGRWSTSGRSASAPSGSTAT